MLNSFSSIALQKKVISALVRLPQGLTANERELGDKINIDTNIVNVHPNPSSNSATIDYYINDVKNVVLNVSDLSGKEFFKWNLSAPSGKIGLNVSKWAAGMYYAKIFREKELLAVTKLITIK